MTVVASVKDLLTRNMRQSGIYIAFVAIIVLFAILTKGVSIGSENVTNIVLQYSYVLILALGMLIVIVAGHIDLSVGSVVAFTGAVSATVVIKYGMPWWMGVLAALVVGFLVGAWQGFWVAYVGVPAFIVTLAGMLLFRGLTQLVLNNISLSPFTPGYQKIAGGFLLNGALGGNGVDVFTLVVAGIGVVGFAYSQFRSRQGRLQYQQSVESMPLFIAKIVLIGAVIMAFAYRLAGNRGLPIVLIIMGVLIVAYSVVTTKTVFGRHVYAIGGNLNAAQLSGVKVRKMNFWIFVNIGVLASVAGVVYSSRSNSAQPAAGQMFELDAIAACFIGGASVSGGIGRIGGAMVGGLVMAVMSNGMQLLGYSQSIQLVVKGLVLLLAVAFDIFNKRRASAAR